MDLGHLEKVRGNRQTRKRVGRGPGSGNGKTSGKGHKGQKARAGGSIPAWFEGGQMPLQRRLPKFGFTNIFRKEYQVVNLDALQKIASGTEVTPLMLQQMRLVRKKNMPIKILGNGELTVKLTVKAHSFSQSAIDKIQKAGGITEVIQ